MSVTEVFIKDIQIATGKEPFTETFWGNYPEKAVHTFQEALDKYAEYYKTLNPEQQKALSEIFWNQIKKIGTPIIEDFLDDKVKVHFLFPRNNYDHEVNKLYLSGDFHGFTSTDNDRQEMKHISNTDIMHRSDPMPRDSIVTYHFLQVPPEYQNKSRQELTGEVLPKSFYDLEDIPEPGKDPLTNIKSDEYAKHTDIGLSIFCANVGNNLSGITLFKDTDWKKLLTDECSGYLKNLTHKGTYLCDKDNHLREDENAADMSKIWNNKEDIRSVSVFQSSNEKIESLIIIHDGVGYMGTGTIEGMDALIGAGKIPKNTAIICISPLPGLIEKYKNESPKEFAEATDPRPIEYASRIDGYITFIDQALKQLGFDNIPAENRTVIGASMSGTASVYMTLKHKDKFGHAIAQAPTEGNRNILRPLMQERVEAKELKKEVEDLSGRIYLSCGRFETLEYAQNIRLAHTKELAEILGSNDQALPVDETGNYGHLPHCWSQELTKTLPLLQQQSLMRAAYIPGMSIATISQDKIQSDSLGCADTQSKSRVKSETQFWACSLSKPVFAYLVLKLTRDGSSLPTNFLDDPLPWDEELLGVQGEKKSLTPRMILSHQTGLPNEGHPDEKFNPGDGFRYSGEGFLYLQKMIAQQTGKSLEELAQTRLFCPLSMTRTSFLFPEDDTSKATTHDEIMIPNPLPKIPANNDNAAGSLHTTAADYARFLMACMNDKDFIELITPQVVSMEKDIDAKEKKLSTETLKPIDWGLGFGLQKNNDGKVIAAFHWGHGPGARTFFAINLEHPPSAVVYLTNSENGLAIAKDIAVSTVGDISPIMKFLSDKYGYEDIYAPNWKTYHELLLKGLKEEKQGDYEQAMVSYQEAVKIHPENPQLQYRLLHAEMENIYKQNQVKFDIKMLAKLSGEYGPLKIVVDGEGIQIIGGGPNNPRKLKIINDNTFLDDDVVLKFERDNKHDPVSLSCHLPNGSKAIFSMSETKKSELASQSFFSHTQASHTVTEKEEDKKLVNRLRGG